jgi:hypothetical protein
MEKRIYDEKNGLWYELHGDYYLPCLTLPEEEHKPVGAWGQRHLRFIREHKRGFYTSLLTAGKLNSYLADIDQQAEEMFFRLVKQMAKKQGVNEELKAADQMEWVGAMNNIRSWAMEMVNEDLIYTNHPITATPTDTECEEPPKVFWKYYDLYRRKRISLTEYAATTGLSAFAIRHYLRNIVEKRPKAIENPKQI